MAWRGRSIGLGRAVGRQWNLKPILCSQGAFPSFQVDQVRHKSWVQLPDLREYVSPPDVSATIFSDWTPVLMMQDGLYQVHDLAGISWVPTIVLSTVALQMLVGLPIRVAQQKTVARLENLMPKIQQLQKDILRETTIAKKIYHWTDAQAHRTIRNAFKKHYRALVKEHNCHPLRQGALAMVQVVPWVTFSMAIRNIAFMLPDNVPEVVTDQQYRYMQLVVENLPWLDSLAAPDPFILPGVFVLASLINIQLATNRPNIETPQKTIQKVLPWVMRGVIVGVGVFGTYLPSAVTLYWAASSSSAVVLNLLMKVPYVRSTVGIPSSPSTTPANAKTSSLKSKFKLRWPFLKSKGPAI